MRRTSRLTRRSPTCLDVAAETGPAQDLWEGADATGVPRRIASATTSAATDAQPVEICLGRAGREHDRQIAVVAGVGRVQRPGEPVVRALRDEMARRLVAAPHR